MLHLNRNTWFIRSGRAEVTERIDFSKSKGLYRFYLYERLMVYCGTPLAPIKITRILSA